MARKVDQGMEEEKTKGILLTNRNAVTANWFGVIDMKTIRAEEIKQLEEGKHFGKVIRIEERLEPYHYIDVIVQEKQSKMEIKTGYPAKISKGKNGSSMLARLLENFGINIETGKDYDVEVLLNKEVQFISINQKAKDGSGEYARIVQDSLRPA